jgi:hypothetical protein
MILYIRSGPDQNQNVESGEALERRKGANNWHFLRAIFEKLFESDLHNAI